MAGAERRAKHVAVDRALGVRVRARPLRDLADALAAHPILPRVAVGGADILTTLEAPLPLSDRWLHEEWHRAVMGNRSIGSFNDVYRFQFGTGSPSGT